VGLCSGGAALRSFRKERISESHSLQPFLSILRSRARESQYEICVGFSNETKYFFFLSHSEGSVPHSDFNDGNNPRTPALQ